jgi:hypothetical protein
MSTVNDADTVRVYPGTSRRVEPTRLYGGGQRGFVDRDLRGDDRRDSRGSLDDSFFDRPVPAEEIDEREVPLRVPRKRGGQAVLLAVVVIGAAGFLAHEAGWAPQIPWRSNGPSPVAAESERAAPASAVPEAPAPAPVVAPAAAAVPQPEAAPPPAPIATTPVAAAKPRPAPAAEADSAEEDAPAVRHRSRRAPLHDMVWSEKAQRLMPASGLEVKEPPPPTESSPPTEPAAPAGAQ